MAALTQQTLEETLKSMGLPVETDGKHFIHAAPGRYAPVISTILTLDEDGSGVTIVSMLKEPITAEKRAPIYELLNFVHGQTLWHFRFHVDDDGRLLAIGRVSLWGKVFNPVQLGDILFSMLVSTDRIYPCVDAIVRENRTGTDAFSLFFLRKNEA